jgi:hypothetical protein
VAAILCIVAKQPPAITFGAWQQAATEHPITPVHVKPIAAKHISKKSGKSAPIAAPNKISIINSRN